MSRRRRLDVLFGDPRLRAGALSALAVVVVFGIVFHVPPSLTLVLVLTVAAVAAVIRLIGSAELGWPLRQSEASSHGWVSVAMLSHTLAVADSSPWEFDRMVQPRLTRLATAALTREGAEWDTARARELLGARVHDALRPDAAPPASDSSRTALVAATLDVLDRLDTPDVRTAS